MLSKKEKAKQFLINGDIKNCLKIIKTFDCFSKDDRGTLIRTFEMFNFCHFYEQLGFNFNEQLQKTNIILKKYFKL